MTETLAETCPLVSVVVLNYNSLAHLRDNLDSLLRLDYPPERLEVLLADNDSTDGSVDWVRAQYPTVRVVLNGANLGFAGGNTAGAWAARGEWVAFLNPDTRVESSWLRELIQPVLRDKQVVCAASTLLSWDGQVIDFADAAMNFMGWGCQPGYGRPYTGATQDKELLFACGGAMLINRQVFLDAGGFDPDYFAYYEDVDLGWRLWLMGHKVASAGRALVYHQHHGSWGGVHEARRWVLAERNTLFTVIKNYDDEHLARVLPATLLLALQRAYLDLWPEPGEGTAASGSPGLAWGIGYYVDQAQHLIRAGDYGQLAQRAADEMGRRWRRMRRLPILPVARPLVPTADGQYEMPAVALGRLLAGRDVLRAWPDLMQKRQAVQAARRRADDQVFPLFKWELMSNFGDSRFIRAMQLVMARFGVARVFERDLSLLDSRVIELSRQASLMLLQMMEQALVLSGVSEEMLRVGGPPLQPVSCVPLASVALLDKANVLLWSLPQATLEEVLTWLVDRCRHIMDEVTPAYG